jgi:hypothetical protein
MGAEQSPAIWSQLMNRVIPLAAALLAAASSSAWAANNSGAGVFSPEKGVVCDRKSGYCADRDGISFGLSEAFLGGTAAHRNFMKRIDEIGYDLFDTKIHTMSNRVKCDHAKEVCKRSDGRVDAGLTDNLFAD